MLFTAEPLRHDSRVVFKGADPCSVDLTAQPPNSDLNFAVDFLRIFILVFQEDFVVQAPKQFKKFPATFVQKTSPSDCCRSLVRAVFGLLPLQAVRSPSFSGYTAELQPGGPSKIQTAWPAKLLQRRALANFLNPSKPLHVWTLVPGKCCVFRRFEPQSPKTMKTFK